MYLGLYSWDDMDLLIEKDSYVPPITPSRINEIELLPGEGDDVESTLQSGAKLRKRASFNLYVRDEQQYNTLVDDYENTTKKIFKDKFGNSFGAIISNMSIGTFMGIHLFNVELMEVE